MAMGQKKELGFWGKLGLLMAKLVSTVILMIVGGTILGLLIVLIFTGIHALSK